MKKTLLSLGLLASYLLSSCSTANDSTNTNTNINFPAVYVVNGQDATLSVININTQQVATTLNLNDNPTGSDIFWPHHINMYQNTLTLGVPGMDLSGGHSGINTSGMTGKMVFVNAINGTIIGQKALPAMNHNTLISPDGTEVWVPQMDSNMSKVLVYNGTNLALKNTINVGKMAEELTFSAQGTKAYVCNHDDNTVSVIDVATKNILATLAVGDGPVGAWPASNNMMYVDNEDGQSVSVIDVASDQVVQTLSLGFMPGMVAYHAGRNELWVTDPDHAKVHYYTWDSGMNMWMAGGDITAGNGAHAIAFSPDGSTAYVTNQLANTVSVFQVSTHAALSTLAVGRKPNGLCVKP